MHLTNRFYRIIIFIFKFFVESYQNYYQICFIFQIIIYFASYIDFFFQYILTLMHFKISYHINHFNCSLKNYFFFIIYILLIKYSLKYYYDEIY